MSLTPTRKRPPAHPPRPRTSPRSNGNGTPTNGTTTEALPGQVRALTAAEVCYLWDHRDQLGDWRETFEEACRRDCIIMWPVKYDDVFPTSLRPVAARPDDDLECGRSL